MGQKLLYPVIDGKKECGNCKEWLTVDNFIKHKDKYSGEIDISKEEASVKSGKTLKDLANLNKEGAVTKSPKVSAAKNKLEKTQKKSPELYNEVQTRVNEILKGK